MCVPSADGQLSGGGMNDYCGTSTQQAAAAAALSASATIGICTSSSPCSSGVGDCDTNSVNDVKIRVCQAVEGGTARYLVTCS